MKHNNALETEPIGKLLAKYAIPAITGTMVMSLYNIIDRIFIGQGVGTDAIAGLALTFPIMSIMTAVGMLVGAGASARISIVLGMKDKVWAEKILGNSLILTLSFSAIYIIGFVLFMDTILAEFGGSSATIPYAHEYLIYLLPGMVLMNLCFSFNGMMRSSGYPTKAMVTMMIGAVINVILDPIFIFTLNMGIKGASIATTISMAISTAFVMHHFMNAHSFIKFHRYSFKLEKRIIRNILSIGLSPFLINITASTVNVLLNRQLQRYGGDIAVGAYGIINSYASFTVMLVLGLCQGMQPIVGYNYGAKQPERLKRIYLLTCGIATAITAVSTLIVELFPEAIARCFTSDAELITVSANGLRMVLYAFPIVGYQIVSTNLFQSISMAKHSIVLSLSRQVLFLIPMLHILPNYMGLDGLWLASPASDVLATLLTIYLIYRERAIFK